MFALSGIRAAAIDLADGPNLDEILADPKRALGRRELHLDGRQGPALRITRSDSVMRSITIAAETWRALRGPEHALALVRVLHGPARVFEGRAPTPGHAQFVLVGSYRVPTGLLGAVVICEQSLTRSRDGEPLVFQHAEVFSLDDDVDALRPLVEIVGATRDPLPLVDSKRPRLLVLGGDRGSVGSDIEAVAAVLGFRADVFGRPESNLGAARRAIGQRRDVIAVWAGAMPHRPDVVAQLVATAEARSVPVLTLGSTSVEDMLDDLQLELLEHDTHVPPPRTMIEALERAKSACPNLTFLAEAEVSARDSPFWRPHQVLDAMQVVDDVVRRWRAGTLPAGIHEAMKEAPVKYASDISDTAKRKYGSAYVVKYGGTDVMLGPHLKFGKKSPERCARVYWVLDEPNKTFVIGHFGRHLPDDTS